MVSNFQTSIICNRRKSDTKALIEIYVYLSDGNPNKKYFSTNIFIEPSNWDAKNKRVKDKDDRYLRINKEILSKKVQIDNYYLKLKDEGKAVTWDGIKALFEGKEAVKLTFVEFMIEQIKGSTLDKNTVKSYMTAVNHLAIFAKELNPKTGKIEFSDIDLKMLEKFRKYLSVNGLRPNSIGKILRITRRFVSVAISHEYMIFNPQIFGTAFKIPSESTSRESLTVDEVKRIAAIEYTKETQYLKKVAERYLFACSTGLRWSDIALLKKLNFYRDGENLFVKIEMEKTGGMVAPPVWNIGRDIIEKLIYENKNDGFLFPSFSNQKANDYLKIIAKLADIDKHLTFHTARHTNAMIAINLGVSISSISKNLGHTDIKTTTIYAKMTTENAQREMLKVNF